MCHTSCCTRTLVINNVPQNAILWEMANANLENKNPNSCSTPFRSESVFTWVFLCLGYCEDDWYSQPAPIQRSTRGDTCHNMPWPLTFLALQLAHSYWKLYFSQLLFFYCSQYCCVFCSHSILASCNSWESGNWCSWGMQQELRTCWIGTSRDKSFLHRITLLVNTDKFAFWVNSQV